MVIIKSGRHQSNPSGEERQNSNNTKPSLCFPDSCSALYCLLHCQCRLCYSRRPLCLCWGNCLGSFLDPLSDKILVGVVFLALTYAGQIPASLTGLIVSRDLFLVYAGLYIRYMSVVPPFTWAKYFDPTLPTATIQPTTISKVNTALQFLLVAVSLGAPNLNYQGHPSLHYLWAATGATTFLSAVSYAFMKDTYKFSHKEYDHQFGKKLFAFILFILFNIGFTLTFPAKPMVKSGADCPVTGGPDPYSEPTNQYYLKMIRNRPREE